MSERDRPGERGGEKEGHRGRKRVEGGMVSSREEGERERRERERGGRERQSPPSTLWPSHTLYTNYKYTHNEYIRPRWQRDSRAQPCASGLDIHYKYAPGLRVKEYV